MIGRAFSRSSVNKQWKVSIGVLGAMKFVYSVVMVAVAGSDLQA